MTLVLKKDGLGATPVAAGFRFHAPIHVFVQVARDHPQGDSGKIRDLRMGRAVTLQPSHSNLALNVRRRVFVTTLRDPFYVSVR